MKKLFVYVMMIMLASSCSMQQSLTANQSHNIRKFSRPKHHRPQHGPRYVRPRRRGDVMDGTISKPTRKVIIKNIKHQRAGGQ